MIAHSSSRQRILDRLRSIPIEASEIEPIDPSRLVRYDNPVAKFTEILTLIGGAVHEVEYLGQVRETLGTLPEFNSARHIASLIPAAVEGNFHCSQVDDPHALATLDWAIVPGEFGVAENGAVWVHPTNLIERTMLFITQHLAVVISRTAMVTQMHDAYQRLRAAGFGSQSGSDFGVFICGPSKTADIEQSLVIGAHGCRTMHVFLTP